METEDIDKWDNSDSPRPNLSGEAEGKSLHKPPEDEGIAEPDSTVQKTPSFEKKPKVKKTNIPKAKKSDNAIPSTTSSIVKSKKKFSVPTEQDETGKKKMSRKSVSSKKEAKLEVKSKSKDKVSLKQMMLNRELEDLGTWVQCGNTDCLKWRYLKEVTDPIEIPQRWECTMNTDKAYNSCEKPEQDFDESEHIYTKYTEGSVVLAKMAGYPWWPGMIEIDPDYDTYFEVAVPASMYPTKYHIVFFDKNVSRAWISISSIRPFTDIDALPRKCKGHDYSREVNAAIKNAKDALDLPIKERLKKFSFSARFAGKWGYYGDKSKTKTQKQKSTCRRPGRRPRKRKLDEDEEHLVDNDTLDQILNNSQSVMSDVVEMLSSIDNGALDSDGDPEFELEKSHKKTNISPMMPALCSETEECHSIKVESEDEEPMVEDGEVKFNVLKLDSDIYTMEMDSDHANALDTNMEIEMDTEIHKKDNMLNTEKAMTEANKQTMESTTDSSSGKRKKKKKVKEMCDENETVQGNANAKEKKAKKKKLNVENSKTKESERKQDSSENQRNTKNDKRKLDGGMRNSKKMKSENETSKANMKQKKTTSKDTDIMQSSQGENSKEPAKEKHKNINNETSEQNEVKQNTSLGDTNIPQAKSEKITKKGKFSNPMQKAVKEDDPLRTDKTKDDPVEESQLSQKGKAKKIQKTSVRKEKKDEPDDDGSDDELDLDFESGHRASNGVENESDEEFMIDLNDTIEEKRQTAQSQAYAEDEDSEPLDFEE